MSRRASYADARELARESELQTTQFGTPERQRRAEVSRLVRVWKQKYPHTRPARVELLAEAVHARDVTGWSAAVRRPDARLSPPGRPLDVPEGFALVSGAALLALFGAVE